MLLSVQAKGQFVMQPGNVTLTGVQGYPLQESVPCVLEETPFKQVSWQLSSGPSISNNHVIYEQYQHFFEFRNSSDKWDYSIIVKNLSSPDVQLQCYAVDADGDMVYSTWSNITVLGKIRNRYLPLVSTIYVDAHLKK